MLFFTYQSGKDRSLIKHCFGEGVGNTPVIRCFESVTWFNLCGGKFGNTSIKIIKEQSFGT